MSVRDKPNSDISYREAMVAMFVSAYFTHNGIPIASHVRVEASFDTIVQRAIDAADSVIRALDAN